MSTPVSLVSEIERAVGKRSLLKHPFYRAWSAGALSKEQLSGYAKEYYWAARNVPRIMEAINAHMPSDLPEREQKILAGQTQDEKAHIRLWERFARSLGITRRELLAYKPTHTVRKAVARILETAKRGFEEGIAAMYAFEQELPAISRSKIDGLKKFYGMRSADAHIYFEEHVKEEKHLRLWRQLLRKVAPQKRQRALAAARSTVAAQNQVLDGVVERYCSGMVC